MFSTLLSFLSTVKRTSSSEQVGPTHRKDSGGESRSNRARTGSTGSNSSGKRASERYSKHIHANPVAPLAPIHLLISILFFKTSYVNRDRDSVYVKCANDPKLRSWTQSQ